MFSIFFLIADIKASIFFSFFNEIEIGFNFFNVGLMLSNFKSDLFKTKIAFSLTKSLKKPVISTLLGSIITKFKSASSALFRASLIPFFSISSLESLIPAVSEITTGYPSILRWVSITSLVVPAISETIATSLFER